ncbi:hypothetical protein [Nostoc sp. ChiQUE01b]|uniref:hypothetical protein n=1 Tax=Nostoc sp. ChiQUE01b TaxID=3075376 RepID=UPI002AD3F1B7|nr:hypothetical protein [Nostoc sp. ChiQUE01b]MDZ8258233.1 hypothetical protein [Nostoc sp. ChiQUE01b]
MAKSLRIANGKSELGENTTFTRREHRSRRSLSCSYNIYVRTEIFFTWCSGGSLRQATAPLRY